jgi:hypothetical protein
MNLVKRPDRAPSLSVLLAMFLWLGATSFAHAAGYWACADGKWVAVGDPGHAMPSKSCGSQLKIPGTKLACEQAGGRWGPAGLFPKPICRIPTHDAGRVCADTGECEGLCLAALTPAQRDLLNKRQKLQILGKCTPYAPMFGCMAIVKAGFVSGIMCRD